MSTKICPICDKDISWLTHKCPYCGADARQRCPACDLPITGKPPCCDFGDECRKGRGQLTWDEGKAATPKSKRANRPDGGTGHGWLRVRRSGVGW